MPKSFLQSNEWVEFKAAQGWQIVKITGFFGLSRALPFGIKLLYLPEISLNFGELKVASLKLKKLLEEIKKIAKQENLCFARLEFLEEFNEQDASSIARADRRLKKLGLQKSLEEMQPEHRLLIDLTKTEQQLFEEMKPKGRYNIRVAQRHGVTIQKSKIKNQNDPLRQSASEASNAKIKTFYGFYHQAAQRDGFTPRPLSYFEQMATHLNDRVTIYVASWEAKPLATALTVSWQGRVSYLYGGSSSEHRNVMAPYLLHWQIIKDAKQAQAKTYDLLATSPQEVSQHKFAGLRRFKEQFGGRSIRVLGSYDLIFDQLRYRLFGLVEKLRGRF